MTGQHGLMNDMDRLNELVTLCPKRDSVKTNKSVEAMAAGGDSGTELHGLDYACQNQPMQRGKEGRMQKSKAGPPFS